MEPGVFATSLIGKAGRSDFDPVSPQTLDEAKNAIKIYITELGKLREENEKLKHENKQLSSQLTLCEDEMGQVNAFVQRYKEHRKRVRGENKLVIGAGL